MKKYKNEIGCFLLLHSFQCTMHMDTHLYMRCGNSIPRQERKQTAKDAAAPHLHISLRRRPPQRLRFCLSFYIHMQLIFFMGNPKCKQWMRRHCLLFRVVHGGEQNQCYELYYFIFNPMQKQERTATSHIFIFIKVGGHHARDGCFKKQN